MKKICEKCKKKFNVVENLSGKTEGSMIISKGTKHKEKLCEKCWKKSRKNCHSKGDKRCGKGSIKGDKRLGTSDIIVGGYSKKAKRDILDRNYEIERLLSIIERLSEENIKLKEELITIDSNFTSPFAEEAS